ncbi:MAG: lytic transglycosylase domain-containing protein [Methylococcales bacterium]|nr:lytic transglycosylase domain-containing protein [Methylococcales bacterium]
MKKTGFILVLVLYSTFSYADIFKRIAPDGSVFYTDKPNDGHKYKRIIKTKKKRKKNQYNYISKNKKKYSSMIAKVAAKYNIDEQLLHAIIRTESAYNEKAVSSAGAVGLMQLMPKTAVRFGVHDRENAAQNIEGGARYIQFLMKKFKSNINLVLASYNAGEGAVIKYHNSIPPYPETQNYVRKVLKYYKHS